MNSLREKNEEKKQEKLRKENQLLQQQPRARESVDNNRGGVESMAAWAHGITRKDLKEAADKIGMTAREVNQWIRYMEQVGWTFASGHPVNGCNFRRPLRMWHKIELKIREEKQLLALADEYNRQAKKNAALREQANSDPSMWVLCRERCKNAAECGCRRGVAVPPDRRQPRPFAPEECEHFKAKEA